MSDNTMSEQEAAELVRQFNEGKQNMHSFLFKVIQHDDSTKMGNLDQDELGRPKLPFRTYKELELFSRDVCSDGVWGDYFQKMGEIQASSSLSKEGFLMKIANTIKKELADVTRRKPNKGWFKNKEGENQQVS